jgi:hypothetical protein
MLRYGIKRVEFSLSCEGWNVKTSDETRFESRKYVAFVNAVFLLRCKQVAVKSYCIDFGFLAPQR